MSYRLYSGELLTAGLRRIAHEQLDAALAELDAAVPGEKIDTSVHELRKRCKKLRALLRLVRAGLGPDYRPENRALRDVGRRLGGYRDDRIVVATHDSLVERYRAVLDDSAAAQLRTRLAAAPDGPAGDVLAELRGTLAALRERSQAWQLDGDAGDVLRRGVRRTFRRARRAFADARRGRAPDAFHELRKATKYHGHHLVLIAELCAESVTDRRRVAEALAETLGLAHDLDDYAARLASLDGDDAVTAEALRALAAWRRDSLHRQAVDIAATLYAGKAAALTGRIEAPADLGS